MGSRGWGPERTTASMTAIGAVAGRRVERRANPGVPRPDRPLVWYVDGVRPPQAVAALLTKFSRMLGGGPYIAVESGRDEAGPVVLTERGRALWARWNR